MASLPSISATLLRDIISCARLSIFWHLLSRSWSAFTRAVDAHEKKVSDRSVKAMIMSNVFISAIFLMVLMWKGEGGCAARGAKPRISFVFEPSEDISNGNAVYKCDCDGKNQC